MKLEWLEDNATKRGTVLDYGLYAGEIRLGWLTKATKHWHIHSELPGRIRPSKPHAPLDEAKKILEDLTLAWFRATGATECNHCKTDPEQPSEPSPTGQSQE